MKTENETIIYDKPIDETNRLIAEFMDFKVKETNSGVLSLYYLTQAGFDQYFTALSDIHYHDDWNQLIDVVEKIENFEDVIIDIHREATDIKIYNADFSIAWKCQEFDQENKIAHVYRAIVKFIENWGMKINPVTGNQIIWGLRKK